MRCREPAVPRDRRVDVRNFPSNLGFGVTGMRFQPWLVLVGALSVQLLVVESGLAQDKPMI